MRWGGKPIADWWLAIADLKNAGKPRFLTAIIQRASGPSGVQITKSGRKRLFLTAIIQGCATKDLRYKQFPR
jgi:hypothetical protein